MISGQLITVAQSINLAHGDCPGAREGAVAVCNSLMSRLGMTSADRREFVGLCGLELREPKPQYFSVEFDERFSMVA